MSDYISREAAVKIAQKYGLVNGSALGRHTGLADCIAIEIEGLPAADVVPVVRCQEREKAVVQLRKKWQDAEMFICTMCGHFDHSIDGNIVYGNKECGEIVGYPCCKKFTPWIPASVRLPKELEPVNVVWKNDNPPPYHSKIRGKLFTGTGVFYGGNWYWYSSICVDLLTEFGNDEFDFVDADIKITHWQPIPELPEEEQR